MYWPNGCSWCGIVKQEHARRWHPIHGWHKWEEPTDRQRKVRMLFNRWKAGKDTPLRGKVIRGKSQRIQVREDT